jgi:hypothetical protein
MITKKQYEKAVSLRDMGQDLINAYNKQKIEAFQKRMQENPVFTDDELRYSAHDLCPCGHGIAYPTGCGSHHYWDCSAILKGIADPTVQHCAKLPFAFYSIKSEGQPSANGSTTRGVFKPKEVKP